MSRISEIFTSVQKEGRKLLLEPEAKTVCKMLSIPTTEFRIIKTAGEAIKSAEEIGFPVALKVVSSQIVHKSDVGGVVLNLETPDQVKSGFCQIVDNVKKCKPQAKILGLIVQEMAEPSTEVIVGTVNDPQFGQTLMFGLGGVFVEILKDVAFGIAPITINEARTMIAEIKAYPILQGYRGSSPVDIEAIAQVLLKVSKLVMDFPEIQELDLNPILAYKSGVKVVDARIVLDSSE